MSTRADTIEGASLSPSTGLYIHIPYCRRRCRYCDFAIVPVGSGETAKNTLGFEKMDLSYREALLDEARTTVTGRPRLKTVYFGGGTPSLAPIQTIEAIWKTLGEKFDLSGLEEATMEMDPGTFSRDQLVSLRKLGINRISLGVQSFDDAVLDAIGRVHRVKDIYISIEMIHEVFGGPNNISISLDLISGLPGVSLAKWAETLELATKLSPNHISIYDLQIEQGTVFGRWYSQGDEIHNQDSNNNVVPQAPSTQRSPLPNPNDCAFQYKYASGYLRKKGYEHYEISSYAAGPHHRSQHNQIYWDPDSQWYAFGLGATSSTQGGKRFARPRAMKDYIEWVSNGATMDTQEAGEEDAMDGDLDRLTDIIMTRLRTSDGLDLDWVDRHFPGTVQFILAGAKLGLDLDLAVLAPRNEHSHGEENGVLKLKDPQGFLFSNSILSSIFLELEK